MAAGVGLAEGDAVAEAICCEWPSGPETAIDGVERFVGSPSSELAMSADVEAEGLNRDASATENVLFVGDFEADEFVVGLLFESIGDKLKLLPALVGVLGPSTLPPVPSWSELAAFCCWAILIPCTTDCLLLAWAGAECETLVRR